MKVSLSRKFSRFRGDERGTVAVMFGLLAIPMVMFVGFAIDYSRVLAADRDLQEAVDAAALAAAVYKVEKEKKSGSLDGTNGEGKSVKQVAVDYVKRNSALSHMKNILPDARESSDDNTLTVTARAEIPTTFARLVLGKFDITAEAKTRMSGEPFALCLVGLHKTAPDAVKASGSAELIAPECAVTSNSTSETGLVTSGSGTMTGAIFCSAGGAAGSGFSPEPETGCLQEPDPYAGKYTQSALAAAGLYVPGSCNQNSVFRARNDTTFNAGSGVFTFCGGLNVGVGATVTFGPGVYVIFADLYINAQGTLKADQGTTIILGDSNWMTGVKDGQIYVNGGGNLLLTAPTTGPTASMAVLQPTVSYYDGDEDSANEHTLIGGGNINIVGNWYTPQSKTRITGNGEINSNSEYFSLVSDIIELEGNGTLTIKAGGDPSAVSMNAVPGKLSAGGHISLIK